MTVVAPAVKVTCISSSTFSEKFISTYRLLRFGTF
jgi:hypothetical protein